jgi:hypothetical protein
MNDMLLPAAFFVKAAILDSGRQSINEGIREHSFQKQ